ncbi:MAG: cohesin domain-containing protein, partial [Bacteroidales bacterium]|nr:cohesin domain-containing protein [Bacteroidales bacterium]
MKNIYLSSVKKLLVLLMLISSLGVTAQTSVTIQPDRIGCVGDTIHIPIHVTGTNVYNMAFYITYDHSVLSQVGPLYYTSVHPSMVVTYNPTFNATTLGCFLDVNGITGLNLNNDKVIDLVFTVGSVGSTTLHIRKSPDTNPVSGIWDDLGAPILPVTYTDNIVTGTNFLPASVTIASNPVMPICPGSTVTFTATPVNGGTNPAFQWKNMNIDIPGATNATYITNTLLRNDQITCVMTSSYPCATGSPATSNVITVTFPYADFIAGIAGTDQAICYNTIPDPLHADDPIGGIAPYSLQWESSTDGILWSPIFGETNNIYAPPALSQTMMYRQMQSYTGICGTETVYTNVVTIQVYPQFVAGSIASSQTRCYGAVPDPLIGIPPVGGKTPYTYQWQKSTDGILFSDIYGATDLNYAPPALNQTTYYQMLQTSSAGCGTVVTNMLTITIHDQLIAGDATPPQTICNGGTPSMLSIINTTGGSGLFTYQWQDSPDGVVWSNIPGATDNTYTFTTPLTMTMHYQAEITDTYCGTNPLTVEVTNPVIITVYDPLIAGDATPPQTICNGGTPGMLSIINTTGGSGLFTYQWQDSPDGVVWSDIPGATDNTYTFTTPLTMTMHYQAEITDTYCGTNPLTVEVTNPVIITVYDPLIAGDATPPQTICNGGTPAMLSIINTTGGSGLFTYQWQDSPDGVVWSNIPGATDNTYTFTTPLTMTMHYQAEITDTYCGTNPLTVEVTNPVIITVYDPLIAGDATPPQTICNGGTPGMLSIINTTGGSGLFTYQWQDSPDGVVWSDIPGATDNTYTFTTPLTMTMHYQAEITDTYCGTNPLTVEVTNPVIITVYDPLIAGDATPPQTICAGETPAMLSIINTTGGSGSFTYQWQDSPDGVVWSNIPGATDNTYTFTTPLTMTMHYQAEITDTYCGTNPLTVEVTNPVTITVNPLPLVSAVALEYSTTGTTPWIPVNGTLGTGYDLCIDTDIPFYYLDINTLVVNVPLASTGFVQNGFKLNTTSLPPTWSAYWNAKGVNAGATPGTWQAVMYQIILGNQPMFYINYTGTDYQLIDGMQYQLNGTIATLRVSGDYPQWAYGYTGSVTDINGCVSNPMNIQMTFNTIPDPTITGPIAACVNSTGNIYTTEAGMTGYTWVVVGGTIVGPSTGNSINVTWTTVGAQ